MIRPTNSAQDDIPVTDQHFGILLDQLAEQLQKGDSESLENFLRDHPDEAERFRQLLPTIQAMAEIAASDEEPAGENPACADQRIFVGEKTLGDFQIVREIGRGGMGVVYEARQISLARRVALKVLPFAAVLDARQLQRFQNEARAAATLDHPGIVNIYSIACDRGVHHYAMQLIEGKTLAEVIRELRALAKDTPRGERAQTAGEISEITSDLVWGRFAPESSQARRDDPTTGYPTDSTPRDALASAETVPELKSGTFSNGSTATREFFRTVAGLGIQAAEALDHAHERGIVHRDIKPGNFMLDQVGHLWITDFGLARIEADASLTMTGDVVGTLRYMSPEQALAKRVVVDQRSDIYSLGATLYELLTLEPAVRGDDREEILRQIAFVDPRPPRRVRRAIPVDLETIVLKAIRKNPDERYETAQELADDLKRFIEDKPIRARRPTIVQRTTKWSRRHRAVVASAVLLLVAVTVGSLISTAMIFQEQRRTEKALARARAQEELAQENARTAERNAEAAERAAAESKAVVDFLVNDMIGAAKPEARMGKDVSVEAVLERAEEKVGSAFPGQPLLEAAIRMSIGKALLSLGQHEKAKQHVTLAREIRMRLLGPEHPDTLMSMASLAYTLAGLGEYEGSRKLRQQTLELRRRILGPEHCETIGSTHELAFSHYQLGEFAKGRTLAEEALALSRRVLGPEHKQTLASMHVLATLLSEQNELAKARTLHEEALEIHRRVFGPEHPNKLGLMNNLSNTLSRLGENARAQKLDEETLEIRRRVLGPEHPDTLMTMNNLAASLSALGEKAQARKLEEETLEIKRRVLGPKHPETQRTIVILASTLEELSEHSQSQKLHEELIELERQKLAHEPAGKVGNLSDALKRLAKCVRRQGKLGQTWKLHEEHLELRKDEPSGENIQETVLLTELAARKLLLDRSAEGDAHKAVVLAETAADSLCRPLEERSTPKDSYLTSHLTTLGWAYYRLGEFERAIGVLQQSQNQEKGGGDHAWNSFLLSMAHWQLGHEDKARLWYARALEWMTLHDPDEQELKVLRDEAMVLGLPRLVETDDGSSLWFTADDRALAAATNQTTINLAIGSPADEIKAASVTPHAVHLTRDGQPLHEGPDYRLHYNPQLDRVQLLASSDSFGEGTYRIRLGAENQPITYHSGSKLPASEFLLRIDSNLPTRKMLLLQAGSQSNSMIRYCVQRQPSIVIPKGAVWKYLADGSNPDTAWRGAAFDDSAWNEGPAQLGFGDKDEATVVGNGTDKDGNFVATYYFRRSFEVPDLIAMPGLVLHLLRDDGAVVYLNGQEVVRSNLDVDSGPGEFARRVVADIEESTYVQFPIDPSHLVQGTNCLAVELHQRGPSSSDISMDLQLTAAGSGLLRFDEMVGTEPGKIPPGSMINRAQLRLVPPVADDGIAAATTTEPKHELKDSQETQDRGAPETSTSEPRQPVEPSPETAKIEYRPPPLTSSLKLYRMGSAWSPEDAKLQEKIAAALQGDDHTGVCGKFDVTADVQAWADGEPNHGWALLQTSAAFEFPLSSAAVGTPQLTIHYLPPEKMADLNWFLANCADPQFRDPPRAVELAERGAKLYPQSSRNWTLLGAALYRSDRYDEAVGALEKSLELGSDSDGTARLFLVMAHAKLDRMDEARLAYEEAVKGIGQDADVSEDVSRLRAEASSLLGVRDVTSMGP